MHQKKEMSYKVKEPTLLSLLICLEKVSKSYICMVTCKRSPGRNIGFVVKILPFGNTFKVTHWLFVYRFGFHGDEVTLALRHLTST